MQHTQSKSLREQLKDWGQKLQAQHPDHTILTNDPENPGYFDTLLQYQDLNNPDTPELNVLNWDEIQILDIHLDLQPYSPGCPYEVCWSFAFHIPNPTHNPDLVEDCLYALRDLLDDDSHTLEYKCLPDSGYILFQIEL